MITMTVHTNGNIDRLYIIGETVGAIDYWHNGGDEFTFELASVNDVFRVYQLIED